MEDTWIQAQLYWHIIRQNMDKDPVFKEYELLDYQFIVISNNSRVPLVWEYPHTTSANTEFYGRNKNIVCKNWREIVTDLDYYLRKNPTTPKEIKKINDIVTWLNNE